MNPAFSSLGKNTKSLPISWLMEKALDTPSMVSLAAGFTDNESLPVDITRDAVHNILSEPGQARRNLQYGTTRGDEKLRNSTSSQLLSYFPEIGSISRQNIVISHGSQQFLYHFSELMLDPRDIVIVEDPTYFVVLGLFESMGVEVIGVELTPSGINLEHLEKILVSLQKQRRLSKLKFFYGVTYYQNPTGWSTNATVKLETLNLLESFESEAGHTIYYLEDAAYFQLGFSGKPPLPSLAFPQHKNRVVFTSTFSKPYSTGIRVGYGILPYDLVNPILFIKTNHDFGTSNFLQAIMAEVIGSGQFDKHLARIKVRYAQKCQHLHTALETYLPNSATWIQPGGGLYIWLQLPDNVDTGMNSKFFNMAIEKEILYVPGALCFAQTSLDSSHGQKYRATIRLSFGGAHESDFEKGAERLGDCIKHLGL